MRELQGSLLTPTGTVPGRVRFAQRIEAIEPDPAAAAGPPWVLPGFIDLHVHGGGGADCMRGEADVRTMARFHARHGTTAFLPTTITAPDAEILAAGEGIGRVLYASGPGEARVLGLHLEGPFISPQRLGAQPPLARAPDPGLLDRLLTLCLVRVLTFAPEVDPDFAFLRHATAQGVRCQIGHSDADDATCAAALEAGAAGFTHLFNAMRPFTHRDPGTAGAALALAERAEIIADLQHAAPVAVRAALRAIPGLYCVTDATEAAGQPDGAYRLGPYPVTKAGDSVRLADGTLAGSVLTMDAALRNLVGLGVPLAQAARRCATVPAEHLGLAERGRIAEKTVADLVVLDADLRVRQVFLEGEPLDGLDAGGEPGSAGEGGGPPRT